MNKNAGRETHRGHHGMRGFAALGARFPKARSKSLGERDE
jgi:hypothetical protein